ncbi:hypothetical protein F4777DRAFT_593140 [Nemania sp. FL0916]|nr:hypothetical protein F4777DRAFT_593140 [Nemania sp. FL0916]
MNSTLIGVSLASLAAAYEHQRTTCINEVSQIQDPWIAQDSQFSSLHVSLDDSFQFDARGLIEDNPHLALRSGSDMVTYPDATATTAARVPISLGSSDFNTNKPRCWEHGCNGREFSSRSNYLRHMRERSGNIVKSAIASDATRMDDRGPASLQFWATSTMLPAGSPNPGQWR